MQLSDAGDYDRAIESVNVDLLKEIEAAVSPKRKEWNFDPDWHDPSKTEKSKKESETSKVRSSKSKAVNPLGSRLYLLKVNSIG